MVCHMPQSKVKVKVVRPSKLEILPFLKSVSFVVHNGSWQVSNQWFLNWGHNLNIFRLDVWYLALFLFIVCSIVNRVICLSVCRLSHSCTLLKRVTLDLDAVCRFRPTCSVQMRVRWGSLAFQRKGQFGDRTPVKTCSCLLNDTRVGAPISDSTSYQITLVTCCEYIVQRQ